MQADICATRAREVSGTVVLDPEHMPFRVPMLWWGSGFYTPDWRAMHKPRILTAYDYRHGAQPGYIPHEFMTHDAYGRWLAEWREHE
jgi:hypothetical protein